MIISNVEVGPIVLEKDSLTPYREVKFRYYLEAVTDAALAEGKLSRVIIIHKVCNALREELEKLESISQNDVLDAQKQLLGQAIGQASMCWDPIPSGIFQSEQANKIVVDLIAKL